MYEDIEITPHIIAGGRKCFIIWTKSSVKQGENLWMVIIYRDHKIYGMWSIITYFVLVLNNSCVTASITIVFMTTNNFSKL